MPEEKSKEQIHKEKVEEFKKEVDKNKEVSRREIIQDFATREILERDYKEDTMDIIWQSSPSSRRKIKSHKPTPEQMTQLLKLQAQAIIFENQPTNEKTIEKLTGIYEEFAELAATLTVKKDLNKEFWFKKITMQSLTNFINELMRTTIQGPLPESELDKFR